MPVSGISPVNPLPPSNRAPTLGNSQAVTSPNGSLSQMLSSPKRVGGHTIMAGTTTARRARTPEPVAPSDAVGIRNPF
jgi:hypothetical protein